MRRLLRFEQYNEITLKLGLKAKHFEIEKLEIKRLRVV